MKSVIRRVAVVGAATALTATTFAGPANAAVAQDSSATRDSSASARNYYGAMALNIRTLSVGQYNDAGTRDGAERMALKRCKLNRLSSYCRKVVWVRNGCAAIAVKYDSKNRPVRYASAYGSQKWPTVRLAKKRAQGSSSAGTVKTRAYLCTTRPR